MIVICCQGIFAASQLLGDCGSSGYGTTVPILKCPRMKALKAIVSIGQQHSRQISGIFGTPMLPERILQVGSESATRIREFGGRGRMCFLKAQGIAVDRIDPVMTVNRAV